MSSPRVTLDRSLASNYLCSIDGHSFDSLTLTALFAAALVAPELICPNSNVSNNELQAINPGWFAGQSGSLATLDVSNNYVQDLGTGTFSVLFALTFLSVSRTQRTCIETRHRDLSGNSFGQIVASTFTGLGNLQELWVSV